ncbi:carboxypeptidase-like regulatory domain-containing protein [Flagellimonas zhangzhouensis]|uniref:CarboxypepD_reg-like domain-containing protein n=1 Tax=Flagellimonas zhangzhouensis TaxID=1073328 RepID=A0A1H2SUH0_9FLAO|nr:carboxypeptidase-like regulatory domain-containing protein [Allomuricauda zhangzhouensis]SDQ79603.1 CarboxypepD_reg-like domain-containing protein [Allomuricauda zhangzhouensis]SDW35316.1 CarboxypepD_reg-like domain-containing protein [Allomuricauda zhangzhouensis]
MRLLKIACFFLLFSGFSYGQNAISGRISDGKSPLSNVKVHNLTSGAQTSSDTQGIYQIKAQPREELRFTYMGMDTVAILVEDVTRILNVKMELKIEELDEVELVSEVGRNKQRILEHQYATNKNLIRTAFGIIDKETFAGRLPILTNKDMISNHYNFGMYLIGKFAGTKVIINPDYTFQVYSRGMGSIMAQQPMIYDIDSQIFTEGPSWLDPNNIERVALMPGINATAKYGTIGAGGVIVVNTKNGTYKANPKEPYDQAKLRNNYMNGKVAQNGNGASKPQYLIDLENSATVEEAKVVYQEKGQVYGNHPNFLLDAYVHFYDVRGQKEFADAILERFVQVSEKNPVMLKALAYTLEDQDRTKDAHEIYKKIYKLRPDYAQSYIDLANSYRNLDMPDSATSLFARHSYLLDEGMLQNDSLNLATLMQREMDNLFLLENSSMKIHKRKKTEQDFYSTRLVFEWNDSEAEFNLQFVNPENQYFNWKHSLAEMPERIRSEKKLGFSMADFLLDDELAGIWKVNVTYLGNKQLSPSYLKATIYKNYGSKIQSKEVQVFKLSTKGANQQFFELRLPSRVANN